MRVNYKKAFELFVGNDQLRPEMHQAFKQGGYYFATDAMGLIYMPIEDAELNYKEQDKPPCISIIPKNAEMKKELNINDIEAKLIPELIDEMKVIEKIIKCTECDGDGSIECELGHCHECIDCDGKGEIEFQIEEPTGNKIARPDKPFMIFNVAFAYWQLKRLIDTCKILGVEKITKVNGKGRGDNHVFSLGNVNVIISPISVYELSNNEDKGIINLANDITEVKIEKDGTDI